jgi:ornithine cyclodeaminase
MEINKNLLYINGRDVQKLGGLDAAQAVKDMERVFSLFDAKDVRVPDKVSMGFGNSIAEEKTKGRINAMPGYLGGEYDMAGVKWIGSNPGNLAKGLPRASGITILNDPETKFPLAILDGTGISAVRTGAVGGLAAKYLAKESSRTLLIIGAGLQAETQLESILATHPELEEIFIFDIVEERARIFAETLSARTGKAILAVKDALTCSQNTDIVVTVTGAASPVIDHNWLNPGALYLNVGGFECTYDTVIKAEVKVVDNWEAVKHRNTSAVAKMANTGLLPEPFIDAELGEIVNGKKPGRQTDAQIVYFNCVGMGIEDIAIATRVYREALRTKTGVWLEYWD